MMEIYPTLKYDDSGFPVIDLQTLLGTVEVDGQFGPQTYLAVKTFQQQNGIFPNGIVDGITWSKLHDQS